MTEILKVDSAKPEKEKIAQAAELIKRGEVVAFPTETVYGLGANALDANAVRKIFVAKERPQDNPIIVHVSDKKQLDELVTEVSEKAGELIDKFWPGPLTLVFKRSDRIPNEVTCGLDTVAIRMPSNKVAHELIRQSFPIAAPSANLSGKPSPTSAEEVFADMDGRIPLILDGGQTDIGLESTVLDLTGEPTLLRPGRVTLEELREVLGEVRVVETSDAPKSPGMKYRHYSPEAEVILADDVQKEVSKFKELGKRVGAISFSEVNADVAFTPKDYEDMARNLFRKMREFDKEVDVIVIEKVPEAGIGLAIMNRLKKAAGA